MNVYAVFIEFCLLRCMRDGSFRTGSFSAARGYA